MKALLFLLAGASPAIAQDYALRATDTVPDVAALSAQILDRDLEYFDGGISRYATGGTYAWTYSDTNGGGVHPGVFEMRDDGVVCITYDTGPTRCDMFVQSGDRLVLLSDDGQRYPLRAIR